MDLRPYQKSIAANATKILSKHGIVYLAMEMRVGKTLTALETARLVLAGPSKNPHRPTNDGFGKRVLFVTKKLGIPSIEQDYSMHAKFKFNLEVINHESVHKVKHIPDLIIVDEGHSIGAFPKPAKRAKQLKEIVKGKPLILLSGTPTPESYSQLYHQLWISDNSPWAKFSSFYKWVAAGYVYPRVVSIGGHTITQYNRANKEAIDRDTKHLFITFTQEQAGFNSPTLTDELIEVDIDERIQELVDILVRDKYYKFRNGDEIICDTPVKLQSKVHQLYSGTVICEPQPGEKTPEARILDRSKAEYIQRKYKGKKIAIFHLYTAEAEALKEVFNNWTHSPEHFRDNKSHVFISQFQSGSRAIDLSTADVIIMYNIHFSSELYQQSRQRGQEHGKTTATKVHWLVSKKGIEKKIYKRVINKQDYTSSYFRSDFGI